MAEREVVAVDPKEGWRWSLAKDVACPRCGVMAGQGCLSGRGSRVWPPHRRRIEAAEKQPKGDA